MSQALVTPILCFYAVFGTWMMLLFVGTRFSRVKTTLLLSASCVGFILEFVALDKIFASENPLLYYAPCVQMPLFLLSCYISPERNWHMVFQLLSSILFCFFIQQVGALSYTLLGESLWAMFLGYVVAIVVVVCFMLKYVLPLSRHNFKQVHQGWWLICLLLGSYNIVMIYVIPGYSSLDIDATVFKGLLTFFMVGAYLIFLTFIATASRESQAKHQVEIAELRAHALIDRMETVYKAEEDVRVLRHDMRHRLRMLRALIEEGKTAEALAFIGSQDEKLGELKTVEWCRDPLLDAAFKVYFEKAEQEKITVDAKIELTEKLEVDTADLAMVIANVLENAIQAVCGMPQEKRWLRVKAIAHPTLMLEVTNPCPKPVVLDAQGFPLTRTQGHGFGTQSLQNFCEKYGAVCEYTQEKGEITLRVVV